MKAACVLLFIIFGLVQASHFRFGTLTWNQPAGSNSSTVRFNLQVVLRASYYTKGLIGVGKTVEFSASDDNSLQFTFGDGTGFSHVYGVIDSLDTANDAFTAHATFTHAYPFSLTAKDYVAQFNSYQRLASLNNNPSKRYIISSTVTLYRLFINSSPTSNTLPIVQAINGTINNLQILASDAQSQALTYTLSTPAEQGTPDSTQPPFTSIDNMGVLHWDVRGGLPFGLWNTQVKICDSVGACSVLDFLLNLTKAVSTPPYFTAPSPSQGQVFTVTEGNQITITIRAKSDTPTDLVTINPGPLPPGSSLSTPSGSNPTDRVFTWTPTNSDGGQVTLNFQTGTATLSFFINVVLLPTVAPTIAPTIAPTPVPPTIAPTPVPPTIAPTVPPTIAPTPVPPTIAPTPVPPTIAPTPVPATAVPLFCGDGICSATENCQICPQDCGTCPMVIYHRATGKVVSTTSYNLGATIALTPYDNTKAPTKLQAWTYDASNGRIISRENPDVFIGAGPVAQRQASTVYTISWDFKAALANVATYTSDVHRFRKLPVETTDRAWFNFLNIQFDGSASTTANIKLASCLLAPYSKPTNAALQEVWGPRCNLTNTNQQFAFFTYVCHSCPVGTLGSEQEVR